MRLVLIALAALLALISMAWLGIRFGLTDYDQRTRDHILEQVMAEIPVGSDAGVMEGYMRKYAQTYSIDERFDHLYAGSLPQSQWDHFLGERKVIVRLRFDSNRRFTSAEVLVTYRTI